MDAFDLVADADASCAQDAPVAVDNQEIVCGIDFVVAPVALKHDVVDAKLVCHCLKFTVVVGDAYRADVGALGKEHLNCHFAVFFEFVGLGSYFHAGSDGCDAGWEKFGCAADFDEAKSAAAVSC